MQHKAGRTAAAVLFLLGPLVVFSIYLVLSRWPMGWFTAATDQVALVLAVVCGLSALLLLPYRRWQKVVITLLYVPVVGALLIAYGIGFVCAVFSACI